MTITLNAEQQQLVADAMQSGGYESADDVIARALEVLRDEEGILHSQRAAVSEKIERGLAQFERGEFFGAEESREDMQRRKAEWRRKQGL